jgi:hypothetical protein
MERDYWLGRKRASFRLAQDATSAEARLIHYDLAGFYSVQSARADRDSSGPAVMPTPAVEQLVPEADSPSIADERYHRELVQGADYLASVASDASIAAEHSRMAAFYLRRAREAASRERLV